jgi:DeoR family fructose operon transcriptional repressor
MTQESYSYIGPDAERTLSGYNADVAFFSCRGLTEDGKASDTSIMENSVRRIMMKNSKRKFLLCDSSKIGKKYLSCLCDEKELDGIICDTEIKK